MLAVEYLRSNAAVYGIQDVNFDERNFHIHVPEGAVPKDGPSAGITMVTAVVSAMTGRKVRKRVAMTGEITLRGKVLPVGGITEKILAAKRAGIKEIILCEQNKKDISEIKPEYIEGLTFHYVTEIPQVIDFALEK
jgi:ATP-dependent Lon protease